MHRLRRYDVFRYAQNDVAPLCFAMMRCLPLCARRHTSLGEAVIIGEANIICRRQTSFKKRTFVGRQKCVLCWCERRDLIIKRGRIYARISEPRVIALRVFRRQAKKYAVPPCKRRTCRGVFSRELRARSLAALHSACGILPCEAY